MVASAMLLLHTEPRYQQIHTHIHISSSFIFLLSSLSFSNFFLLSIQGFTPFLTVLKFLKREEAATVTVSVRYQFPPILINL
jgi:hypothetical protein